MIRDLLINKLQAASVFVVKILNNQYKLSSYDQLTLNKFRTYGFMLFQNIGNAVHALSDH